MKQILHSLLFALSLGIVAPTWAKEQDTLEKEELKKEDQLLLEILPPLKRGMLGGTILGSTATFGSMLLLAQSKNLIWTKWLPNIVDINNEDGSLYVLPVVLAVYTAVMLYSYFQTKEIQKELAERNQKQA